MSTLLRMVLREKFGEIKKGLGLAPPDVRSGSTVLRQDVDEVAAALGVRPAASVQETWNSIIESLGGVPEPTDISHPGSGTITDQGFDKVLAALDALQSAPLGEPDAARASAQENPSVEDAGRRRVLAEVTRRQGQPLFRSTLLDVYGNVCCISGVTDVEVIEAATFGSTTDHTRTESPTAFPFGRTFTRCSTVA
jgi:hypothetical protein